MTGNGDVPTPPSAPIGRPKVFGIGLHKTSTTSLVNALYTLGYYSAGYWDTGAFADRDELVRHAVDEAGRYDAVQDMPWPAFYRELDVAYPGSKFILTVRDPDRWIASVVTHFADTPIASHEFFYDVPTASGHEERYLERFHQHNAEVREYFADRPDDLLVMDIAAGDGWEPLCGFLGVPVPTFPFSHQNQATRRRSTRYQRAAERILRAGGRRLKVPELLLPGNAIDAGTAYATVHSLCGHVDQLVAALDGPDLADDDTAHLAGMLRVLLEQVADWVDDNDTVGDGPQARLALSDWDIGRAWAVLRLRVRQWAADITDEGTGVRDRDGSDAADPLRRLVNGAIEQTTLAARACGVELREPLPEQPLSPL